MNQLELTLVRIAFLAVLWLFVIAAVGVIRTDLLGHISSAASVPGAVPQPRPAKVKPARPARPARSAPQQLLVTAGRAGRHQHGPERPADHHRPGR